MVDVIYKELFKTSRVVSSVICLTERDSYKQHKRIPQKVFIKNTKALGGLLYTAFVHSFMGFPEFPVHPYYEPLAWFMIIHHI